MGSGSDISIVQGVFLCTVVAALAWTGFYIGIEHLRVNFWLIAPPVVLIPLGVIGLVVENLLRTEGDG